MHPEDPLSTVHPLVVPEIVTLPREIDIHNAPGIGHELTSALAGGPRVLIADMLLTEFCDSTGIRHLLIADKAARLSGAELRLVVQSHAVLKVMRTLGIDQVLRIYDSMGAALSGPPAPPPPGPV